MILFEITQTEENPVYQDLEIENVNRQYGFLKSIVQASLGVQRPFLSQNIIRALNFHAIACLHVHAGEYRPCPVYVGAYNPPEHWRVSALMDDFINNINLIWDRTDAVVLAALVLWKLNHIHPFINGNGRSARAACHFVLCVKAGGWLGGDPILPQLLDRDHDDYVNALRATDASAVAGVLDIRPLHELITRLLNEQLGLSPTAASTPSTDAKPGE